MDTLPEIALSSEDDPVVLLDGAFRLRLSGGLLPLRVGGAPVESFVAGWRPNFVYTGFASFLVLHFISDSGEVAVWIVDADGNRLGGDLRELEPDARDALRVAAAPRVAHLMDTLLRDPAASLDAEDRSFLRLPEAFRREIGHLCAALALPPVRRVVLGVAPDAWDDAWGLDCSHVETILAVPFGDRLLQSAHDGMLSWPSPVDGRPLRVQGSLCSDDFRFAYRLADSVHGVICYPIVSDHTAQTIGLYVPASRLLLLRKGWAETWLEIYVPSLADWLVPLVCRFGDVLEGYLQKGASRVVSIMRGPPSTHLGHQLWNELGGIDQFLQSAFGPHLPEWVVPGPGIELWGPIDKIYPELEGRVDRSSPDADSVIRASYKGGACLVRVTGRYVSAKLRAGLRRTVRADPVCKEVSQIVSGRGRPNAPVILIGLRVENRTVVDLLEFCEELLERVANAFPGAILVLDGHNSSDDGRVIISHGEQRALQPPLEVERQIAKHLQRLQVGRDVTVISTLGAPIRASLAWCDASDCFFSIWGASLSKYRWACNKPGLVVTNHWNRTQRDDLHIYDSPDFMETPSELAFVDADLVYDRPGAPLLVDVGPGQPSFFNFEVNQERFFSIFIEFIQKHQK